MSDINKVIQEHNASRKLNILKGFKGVEETLEKARSGKYADTSENKKLARVGQEYGGMKKMDMKEEQETGMDTDKPDMGSNKPDMGEGEMRDGDMMGGDMKSTEDHAAETPTEDLMNYLENNPEGEHAAEAMAELESRDEGMDMDSEDMSGDEEIMGETYQSPETETLDQFYSLPPEAQREIAMASVKHNINLGTAMQMYMENGGSNEETHAKIDAAQMAIDDLKSHSGHPDSMGMDEEEMMEDDELGYDEDEDAGYGRTEDNRPEERDVGVDGEEIMDYNSFSDDSLMREFEEITGLDSEDHNREEMIQMLENA